MGEDAMHRAAQEGHDGSSLLWASRSGHPKVVELLLDRRADVDAADRVRMRVVRATRTHGCRSAARTARRACRRALQPLHRGARSHLTCQTHCKQQLSVLDTVW